MTRDTQSRINKKDMPIRSKKASVEKTQKKKKDESSDSDNDLLSSDEEEEEEIDAQEYRKMLKKIFPSKYLDKKIAAGERLKKHLKEESESEEESEEEEEVEVKKKGSKSKKSVDKKKKTKKEEESEEEEENIVLKKKSKKSKRVESESEEEEDEEDEEEEEEEESTHKRGSSKFNIIFTIGNGEDEDDEEWEDVDDSEDDSDDDDDETEDEDVSVSDSSEEEEEEEEEPRKKGNGKAPKPPTLTRSSKSDCLDKTEENTAEFVNQMKELYEKNKNSPMAKECLKLCEQSVKKTQEKQERKMQKQKDKNSRIFRRIVKDKNTMNDFEFFGKLETEGQKKIIKELREINKLTRVDKPYRLTLLESDMPTLFKGAAMKKINSLRYMEPGSGEYYKIKNWVDTFMRLPFGKYQTLPINIDDGIEKCHDFMENAKKTLDSAVYGLNDAKMQIMQMLGQLVTNPVSIGTAIAIQGPMGTGKCHGKDTPILLYDGSIKMVQDIVVGDIVMGDDSTPRKVMSLGGGRDEMFDVISKKGIKYSVNSEHILCLRTHGMNRIKPMKNYTGEVHSYKTIYFDKATCKYKHKTFSTMELASAYLDELTFREKDDILQISVKEYLKLPEHIQITLKGYTTGVEFETKPILFDPYMIGAWLGDGHSNKSMITNQDSENKNIFMETLRHYNLLDNKHIPYEYKTNNSQIRLELLAGLIDTDGYFDRRGRYFEITQKSKKLSDDIVYLARSLGFCATQTETEKYCMYKNEKSSHLYYRVNIYGENIHTIPTKCPRKQTSYRPKQKNALVSSISVISKGMGNYYGFELDGNHRYVLGNFTVTHNTTLVKEGISKILNRPFAFIALGGATDSSFLEGHSYTYEGSTWGKIVQILIDSKCMNPVIYFDELDKISDTPKGEEIAGILTHLTDTSQNNQYHDKYFAEVDFDLSKCLFIFSYNDESKINPILRDRMYRIHTKGYDTKQKTIISNQYLLPKIREQVKFSNEDIIIPDESLHYLMENHCNKEDGVRNMKRCLEIIYTKLNLYRLMKPGTNLFEEDMSLTVEFPFTVTKAIIDKLIVKEREDNMALRGMYV